jgi:hypothetical protein
VDEGAGGFHHKYPFHNQRTMNSENVRILVTDFGLKSYKVFYFFIYFILGCNHKVMADATNYCTMLGP